MPFPLSGAVAGSAFHTCVTQFPQKMADTGHTRTCAYLHTRTHVCTLAHMCTLYMHTCACTSCVCPCAQGHTRMHTHAQHHIHVHTRVRTTVLPNSVTSGHNEQLDAQAPWPQEVPTVSWLDWGPLSPWPPPPEDPRRWE